MADVNKIVLPSSTVRSLYDISSSYVVFAFKHNEKIVKELPKDMQFDILYQMFSMEYMRLLMSTLSSLPTFSTLLRVRDKRLKLHKVFQTLMDRGFNLAEELSDLYVDEKEKLHTNGSSVSAENTDDAIILGFMLGDFLHEAGWFKYAENVFTSCLQLIQRRSDKKYIRLALDCCARILRVQNGNCCYAKAAAMADCTMDILSELDADTRQSINKASLYAELTVLQFAKSQYDAAFNNSLNALSEIDRGTAPVTVVIDVLRLCSKACVIKREFKSAELLIKNAVKIAWNRFGPHHPKYADALLDYGFYLLNIDHICQSVAVYEKALAIRQEVYGGNNLHVAVAHEDLAYAHYVHEYNSGNFDKATEHADTAISMLTKVLPPNHLLLASSKRVRALVLEEMAIDSPSNKERQCLLKEALKLHKESLALAKNAFGEKNVQTAKHYGNLGRLYQTLKEWNKAEKMHILAINIKEELLGVEDYEVALSIGHLASLYNYDMEKYSEAEELYKRSIYISTKLFGQGYSGLEYDYRGLIHLYEELHQHDKIIEYIDNLHSWSRIRDHQEEQMGDPLEFLNSEQFSQTDQFTSILQNSTAWSKLTEGKHEAMDVDLPNLSYLAKSCS